MITRSILYTCLTALAFMTSAGSTSCQTPSEDVVTIWIHGTKLTPRFIFPHFFYRKVGLHPASSYDNKYHMRLMAETLCSDKTAFSFEHFYFFGWSGKLSFQERKNAAQHLYNEIQALQKQYRARTGTSPKIRIITHSHGGNVALNLAHYVADESTLLIDELILLACPVQDQTMHLMAHPVFKKVFSIYSDKDMIQVIDPQGLYARGTSGSLFSRRTFPPLDKLVQIKIFMGERSLAHIEFLMLNFLRILPEIIQEVPSFHSNMCSANIGKHRNAQQHHYEPIVTITSC